MTSNPPTVEERVQSAVRDGLDSLQGTAHHLPPKTRQRVVEAVTRAVLAASPVGQPTRADMLLDAADCAYRIARRLDAQHHDQRAQGAWDVENVLRSQARMAVEADGRRVADEEQPAEAQQQPETEARPVSLATPCILCQHPFNWHDRKGCQFGNEVNRCGCRAFSPGEKPAPVDPRTILGIAAPVEPAAADSEETRRCACPHPADEHSVYGCVDGCGCEWMPRRSPTRPAEPPV